MKQQPQPQPLNLFADTNTDLPLFSLTPQRATVPSFRPAEAIRQPSMFAATACPVCFGTHQVKNRNHKTIPCMFCK